MTSLPLPNQNLFAGGFMSGHIQQSDSEYITVPVPQFGNIEKNQPPGAPIKKRKINNQSINNNSCKKLNFDDDSVEK